MVGLNSPCCSNPVGIYSVMVEYQSCTSMKDSSSVYRELPRQIVMHIPVVRDPASIVPPPRKLERTRHIPYDVIGDRQILGMRSPAEITLRFWLEDEASSGLSIGPRSI